MNATKWTHYAALFIGWAFCLPTMMLGYELCKNYGYGTAVAMVMLGNAILFSLSLIMIHLSAQLRISTLAVALKVFGPRGKILFTLTMVALMIGWFAINLDAMSSSISLVGLSITGYSIPIWIVNITMGLVMSACSLVFFNSMGSVAVIMLLPFVATIIFALTRTSVHYDFLQLLLPGNVGYSIAGLAFVIAYYFTLIIDLPTFTQSAYSKADAIKGLFVTLIIGVPLIEFIGVVFAISSPFESLAEKILTGGVIWKLWIMLCFMASTWFANWGNLYSAMISLKTVFTRYRPALFTLLFGAMGTALACTGLSSQLERVLDIMGILMSGMGAIIIAWYVTVLFRRCAQNSNSAFIAWFMGVMTGLMNACKIFQLTQSALIDTALVASGSYMLLMAGATLTGFMKKTKFCYKEMGGL